jgi:hypothetical protein
MNKQHQVNIVLETLVLSSNSITDESGPRLALALSLNTTLKTLNLEGNEFTSESAELFAVNLR